MSADADDLEELDPDDSRPSSQQIANVLRAAIRTGRFAPGERLPSQNDLAERYRVARETVKAALRTLREEHLVVSRQGSGAFVRSQTEKPVGLRPHIEAAFERRDVSIDFAGYAAETLQGVLSEPLDKIRSGRLTPESVHVRMLLPDLSVPMALPARADSGEDDKAIRGRTQRIADRCIAAITDTIRELQELGLVKAASVETRTYSSSPVFKLYIINGAEAFFGFYPVVKHSVTVSGKAVQIFDPMGKDATMFHFTNADDDAYGQYVEQSKNWFESIWNTVAKPRPE